MLSIGLQWKLVMTSNYIKLTVKKCASVLLPTDTRRGSFFKTPVFTEFQIGLLLFVIESQIFKISGIEQSTNCSDPTLYSKLKIFAGF